jgi:dihydroflavonol-4-reductase
MEACAAARIRRVVVTSSAVTMGFSRDPQRPFDEHQENDGRGQDEYNESKWRAERMAFQRGGELGIEVVTVHPSLVLGPGDHHVTPSNRVVTDFLLGRIPGWYEGGFSPVHVDDVARGHILAMTAGRAGERYLLTGTNVRFRELLERLGALTGLGVPRLRIPKRAALLAAATYELAARLGGPPPLVTRAAVHHLYGTYDWYDCSKARRELAYAPRPLDEVLVDALLWFLEQGDRVPPRRRHDVLLHLRSR